MDHVQDAWYDAPMQRLKKIAGTLEGHAKSLRRYIAVLSQQKDFNRYDVTKSLSGEARDFWVTHFGAEHHSVETSRFIEVLIHASNSKGEFLLPDGSILTSNAHEWRFFTKRIPSLRKRNSTGPGTSTTEEDKPALAPSPSLGPPSTTRQPSLTSTTGSSNDEAKTEQKCARCNAPMTEGEMKAACPAVTNDLREDQRAIVYEALAHLLDSDHDGRVTPRDLKSFLSVFGPLEKCYIKSVLSIVDLPNSVIYPWFYGRDLDRDALQTKSFSPPGTFAVRFSSHGGSLVLSVVQQDGEWDHIKVSHCNYTILLSYYHTIIVSYCHTIIVSYWHSSHLAVL